MLFKQLLMAGTAAAVDSIAVGSIRLPNKSASCCIICIPQPSSKVNFLSLLPLVVAVSCWTTHNPCQLHYCPSMLLPD